MTAIRTSSLPILVIAGLSLFGLAGLGFFATNLHANTKVTICHATSSESTPFVEISVSANALTAHEKHGDIIPAPEIGCPNEPAPEDPPDGPQ